MKSDSRNALQTWMKERKLKIELHNYCSVSQHANWSIDGDIIYLVDSPEGADIDGLTPDGTGTSNTGGVLTRSGVDDGINQNLNGVLEKKYCIINMPSSGQKTFVYVREIVIVSVGQVAFTSLNLQRSWW